MESGKGLSTNDYDDTAKGKVDAIPHDPKYTDTVYDDTAVRGRLTAIEGKEASWDAKSDFSGEYDDLIGKPSVDEAPTEDSQNLVYSGGVHSFVNSSVSTNTAYYISDDGEPFTSVEDLEAYADTVTNNDYAFVTGTDEDGNIFFDRYKATVIGTTVSWAKEYRLNNSSFTASQWAAISSGVTDVLVAAYNAHVANSGIHVSATDRTNWNGKYSKPSSGIPATDLASAVRGSLAKADSAVQPEPGKGLFSGSWNDLTDKPDISGAFNVVYGTTIASEIEEAIEEGKQPVCYRNDIRYDYAGINNGYHCFTSVISVFVEGIYVSGSAWGEMSIAIATGDMIPTKTSDITNDSGFITDDELDGYATEEWVEDQGYLTEHQSLAAYRTASAQDTIDNGKENKIPTVEISYSQVIGDSSPFVIQLTNEQYNAILSTDYNFVIMDVRTVVGENVVMPKMFLNTGDISGTVFIPHNSTISSGIKMLNFYMPAISTPHMMYLFEQNFYSELATQSYVNSAVSAKYTKPSGGIPKADLASAVQTSLGLADSALQAVPNTYRTAAAQDVIDAGKIPTSEKGSNNGVAELDSSGKVPQSQLPSYVDDVLSYASKTDFPATGEDGKIYIAKDVNKSYRWGGSEYVEISPSIALGETISTAYRGDRGKIAYDHSQSGTVGGHHTLTPTPSEYIYKIDGKHISAEYDGNENQISSTYATKTEVNAKYAKPSSGIPKTDLASAVQSSLDKADAAAPKASPAFTGTPTAPTATTGTNTTQVATTAFVNASVTAHDPTVAEIDAAALSMWGV